MSSRVRTFDRSLREVVRPVLHAQGFVFDQRRTFRRIHAQRRFAEMIHFQIGQRSLAGRFTVNLGMLAPEDMDGIDPEKARPHDCPFENRVRIGFLLPASIPALSRLPLLGVLLAAKDRWWRFSEDETYTSRQLTKVMDLVLTYGLPWFATKVLLPPGQQPKP